MKRLLSTLAITSCLLTGFSATTWAQSLPGITLFSGVDRNAQLPYRLDFGGQANSTDRYTLKVPAKKMRSAVTKFEITYPHYYRGTFDTKDIEVRVKGKSVPLSEVKWDKEGRVIEIFPQEPVPARAKLELVLSNVQNPTYSGMFNFECKVLYSGDVLSRYIGTWIISIS
jgi:hypothetical protein